MKINGKKVKGGAFAYDGCHKIYILEDAQDEKNAIDCGYKVYSLSKIENIYNRSCGLRFINNWKLDKTYSAQGEYAKIEKDEKEKSKEFARDRMKKMFEDYMYYGYGIGYFMDQNYPITKLFTKRELRETWQEVSEKMEKDY